MPSGGVARLYDQLAVPAARFQVSLEAEQLEPFQYMPLESCRIETSTLARPEAEPSLSGSVALPQMSSTPCVEQPAV